MSVMRAPEIPEIWADPDRMLTVEDMEDMPDDEFRYELDDGMLIVSPAPSLPHRRNTACRCPKRRLPPQVSGW